MPGVVSAVAGKSDKVTVKCSRDRISQNQAGLISASSNMVQSMMQPNGRDSTAPAQSSTRVGKWPAVLHWWPFGGASIVSGYAQRSLELSPVGLFQYNAGPDTHWFIPGGDRAQGWKWCNVLCPKDQSLMFFLEKNYFHIFGDADEDILNEIPGKPFTEKVNGEICSIVISNWGILKSHLPIDKKCFLIEVKR